MKARPVKGMETAIQRSIMDYLWLRKVFFYRQNSGAFRNSKGDFYQMSTPGAPDIVVVKDGVYIGLEVKTPTGKMNENQEIFRDRLTAAGGRYHVVRSIEDVQALGL